jgi:hypothetical protein
MFSNSCPGSDNFRQELFLNFRPFMQIILAIRKIISRKIPGKNRKALGDGKEKQKSPSVWRGFNLSLET